MPHRADAPPPARLLLAVAAAATLVAGCGSAARADYPPPAAPADARPRAAAPPGRSVAVGPGAEGVAVDPVSRRVAVAVRKPAALVVLGAGDVRVRRRVALPGPARHVALAGPGGAFLVPAGGGLTTVDPATGETDTVPTGPAPHDAVAAGGRVLVVDGRASTLSAVEAGRVTARVRVAREPVDIVALDKGRRVAVLSGRERILEIYDAASLRRLASAPAGSGPAHVVSDGGVRLYVADTTGNALLVFLQVGRELALTRRQYLDGAPYGMAFDPLDRRIWATQTLLNRVSEYSAGSLPRVLRRFGTVRQADSVAVDPRTGRVFVAGRADGTLQAFDPPPLRSRRR